MYYMKNLGINQNEKGLRIERVYREPLDCEPHSRHSLSVNAIEQKENECRECGSQSRGSR